MVETSATPTSPWPGLITQFAPPASCSSIFELLSTETSVGTANGVTSTWTSSILTSDEANNAFSKCQPSGWEQRHFQFSPGVCPSDWGYWGLTATSSGSVAVSQALCCARSYTLYHESEGNDCISSTYNGQTSTILRHSPWLVHWQTSDTSSFDFSIPALTSSRSVAQWTPGQSLSPTAGYDDNKTGSGDSYGGLRGGVLAAVIAVPVIVFLLAVGGCVACFVVRKKRRRHAQEIRTAQDARQQ
ncbi:hypothetical protein LEL_10246 [Akanthomyces lecanii RCEF 1005]|uniref:Uncharacterized protein n=1 Tax=Akanthomyces lecanii RCEF 1005 TaxID=1081108 RepID=A0A168AYM4_CORDF|nr:hypothetical protein LEL_10246 [Akanthomyces lecanii RCEF 1005]